MKRPIIEINFRNDFDFILTLKSKDGKVIGFPEYDFEGRITSVRGHHGPRCEEIFGYEGKGYDFSKRGSVIKNCFNDNGKLHIVMNHHRLPPGRLMLDFVSFLPNPMYADGSRRVEHKEPLMIELVEHCGDSNLFVQDEEVIMPYVYKTAYELAVDGGYDGTQEEFQESLSKVGGLYKMAQEAGEELKKLQDKARELGYGVHHLDKKLSKLREETSEGLRLQEERISLLGESVRQGEKKTEERLSGLEDSFLENSQGLEKGLEEAQEAIEGLKQELDQKIEDGYQSLGQAITSLKEECDRIHTEQGNRIKEAESKVSALDSYVKEWFKVAAQDVHRETQRAQAAESQLKVESGKLKDDIAELLKMLSMEAGTRENEDERIESRIENLKSLVKGNTSSIESETNRAKLVEKDLADSLQKIKQGYVNSDTFEKKTKEMEEDFEHEIEDLKHYADDAVHALDDSIEPVSLPTIQGWFRKG
ncbi:MAG: hypothetical protein J1E16_04160 [Muribaculaceae bacterium]|nr:hypothetical protein [Muribaculaceae bacterium]